MSEEEEREEENGREPVPTPEVVQAPVTMEDYAEAITAAYRDTVEGVFRMGDLLREAKEELPHGEYGKMVEEHLPFGKRTSRKLRRIARDPRLRNRTQWSGLPSSWTTLHRLAQLDDREWEQVEPHISPEMTGSEIPELIAKGAQLRLAAPEERDADEKLEVILRQLPSDHRVWVKRKLQGTRTVTKVRLARGLAEMGEEERERLIERDERAEFLKRREEERASSIQIALPGFARRAREELLERDALDDPRMEGARSALSLQALLRWAEAFTERTDSESVVDGLWAVRRPEKVAEDARSVAEWLRGMADEIEWEEAFRRAEPREAGVASGASASC